MILGDQISKMEVCVLIIRMLNFVILVMEMLLLESANSLGVTDLQFPRKFNGYNDLKPEKTSTGRMSRSGLLSDLNTKTHIGDDSIKESRILEFIDKISTNSNAAESYCAQPEGVINLSRFDYTFESSAFQSFHKQAKEARFIASYLNDLYEQDPNFELRSLIDNNTLAVVSWLRSVLIDDSILAGAGIAFDNNFFPYIYKTNSGLKSDDLNGKHGYKNADFYSFHSRKIISKSKFSSTSASGSNVHEEDIYWGSPSFECIYLKKWLTSVSVPFHSKHGDDIILK